MFFGKSSKIYINAKIARFTVDIKLLRYKNVFSNPVTCIKRLHHLLRDACRGVCIRVISSVISASRDLIFSRQLFILAVGISHCALKLLGEGLHASKDGPVTGTSTKITKIEDVI